MRWVKEKKHSLMIFNQVIKGPSILLGGFLSRQKNGGLKDIVGVSM